MDSSLSRSAFGALAASQVVLVIGAARVATAFITIECPIRSLTGWQCPGCGSTRCVAALGTGDFVTAFRQNVLLTVAFFGSMLICLVGVFSPAVAQQVRAAISTRQKLYAWILVLVILVFAVSRNLN